MDPAVRDRAEHPSVLRLGVRHVLPEGGEDLPFGSLEVFERCVALVARRLGL